MIKSEHLLCMASVICLFSFCEPSFAISRYICADALTNNHQVQTALNAFRDRQESQLLVHAMKPRALTPVEIDAFVDFYYGIPVLITFSDGKSQEFKADKKSLLKFFTQLRGTLISSVDYPPESIAMIGNILREACVVVHGSQGQCDVYRHFQGLASPGVRPFTPTQEQIIKWLVISSAPHYLLTTFYQGMSAREVANHLDSFARSQMALAQKMLTAAFTEHESEILFKYYLRPKIVEGSVSFAITVNTVRH